MKGHSPGSGRSRPDRSIVALTVAEAVKWLRFAGSRREMGGLVRRLGNQLWRLGSAVDDRAPVRVSEPALQIIRGYSAALAIGGSFRTARSKRSSSMTFAQAFAKSFANFSFESAQA